MIDGSPYDDVHPTKEWYERIAKVIACEVDKHFIDSLNNKNQKNEGSDILDILDD